MDDLAAKLRAYAKNQDGWHEIDETCEDAADLRAIAIELRSNEAKAHVYSVKMRQENERLREALQGLLDEQNGPPLIARAAEWQAAVDAAHEALKESGDE